MNEEMQLAEYFAILRRWKKIFLAVTFVLLALSLVFAMNWSKYQSTAVVQIDPAEIAASATTPAGTPQQDQIEALADQRISAISQKVLSTGSLIEVISKFDLYHTKRSHDPIADIAVAMSKKIKIDLISGDLANPAAAGHVSADNLAAIAFKLSFTYNNPLIAQQVTDELVNRFLDEDLKERRTQAQETAAFLGAQIDDLEKTISEQEKKIADFEKENGVSRPESLAFNQQAAATLTLDLQNLDSEMMANEGTIGSLRAQLAGVDPYARISTDGQVMTTPTIQLKALRSQYASLTAQYGAEHPDVVKVRSQIEALQKQTGDTSTNNAQLKAQITDIQTNLAAAQKTYGDSHPDVIALKNQLQNLEDQARFGNSPSNNTKDGIITDADNPTYLQFAAQLKAAQEQHKALVNQRKELKTQQATYQKAVIANPEAAKEMAALTRDYENAQLRFRGLREKDGCGHDCQNAGRSQRPAHDTDRPAATASRHAPGSPASLARGHIHVLYRRHMLCHHSSAHEPEYRRRPAPRIHHRHGTTGIHSAHLHNGRARPTGKNLWGVERHCKTPQACFRALKGDFNG